MPLMGRRMLTLLTSRTCPRKSFCILSASVTPVTVNVPLACLTPNTKCPPAVLAKALTVESASLGTAHAASLNSMSLHSMDWRRAISSSLVMALLDHEAQLGGIFALAALVHEGIEAFAQVVRRGWRAT
ncbi:hypothetical protein PO78_4452 [Thauera sp. SWB20]|nr:hypothetical protein PO78_4452 [Thauera sp. SWB20]